MADNLTPEQRRHTMARVKGRDTGAELYVRKELFRAGFRYRLHRHDLPGKPDIVLPKFRVAVLVHGCFWHGHDCPAGARPKSNQAYWEKKLSRNLQRDRSVVRELAQVGWLPITIWECEKAAATTDLIRRLSKPIPALEVNAWLTAGFLPS